MRDNLHEFSLTFPSISVGELETPPDLQRLLYKGGASVKANKAKQFIQEGLFGEIRRERIELVHSIHAYITGKLAGGGSSVTARNQIRLTSAFFAWADEVNEPLTIGEVQATYLKWADYLLHRIKVVRNLTENAAYTSALRVGQVLDDVLERQMPILHLTRHIRPSQRKSPQGVKAEKQSLQGTFRFGHLLQDICDGLPLSVVLGSLKVQIPLRAGGVVTLWTGGSSPRRDIERAAWELRNIEKIKQAYANDRSLKHRGRRAIVNTRILAELLMFIGQTGMNLAQAHKLELRRFNYSSDIDGYKVRDYKHRRGGEVLFEVFSEYRSHLERYLEWRRALFPGSKELFPFIREGSHEGKPPGFHLIIRACEQAGVPWTPPSMLRGTRVNWLLRRSGDPDLTADVVQHHKQTLLESYARPSLQRAIGEVTRFWQDNDPALASAKPSRAVAPGQCDGEPVASSAKPETAPMPDCMRPSGCLWCEHHRDIDSLDYVWSLVCFRHLKVLELSKHCFLPPTVEIQMHPAQYAIDRLSEKLTWFKNSNAIRRSWVEEALARVEEGNYHGEWRQFIQNTEGTA